MKNMENENMEAKKGKQAKVKKFVGKSKKGVVHSGSKKGPKAKSQKQAAAVAIALKQRGMSNQRKGW